MPPTVENGEREMEPGPMVLYGVPSIPPEHTASTASLLKWEPVSVLVRDTLKANIKHVDDFPLEEELKQRLLVDTFEASALSSSDYGEELVWQYVKSFEDNIQHTYPLIIPDELNAMVKRFLNTTQSRSRQSRTVGVAGFVGLPSLHSPAPAPSVSLSAAELEFEWSIDNVRVLLVLALGKTCLRAPSHGSAWNGSVASPKEGVERPEPSRRSSFQRAESAGRNVDVIPGLNYFALADRILGGGHKAGTSIEHIHANLLAALYHGQLGRPFESYRYIRGASDGLQIQIAA
jgi:hypothetical protein